jgi:hypothetical protein
MAPLVRPSQPPQERIWEAGEATGLPLGALPIGRGSQVRGGGRHERHTRLVR